MQRKIIFKWNAITKKFKYEWNDQFKKMEESYDVLKNKIHRNCNYSKVKAKRDHDSYLQTRGWCE